jgi:hypothetical protein
MIRDGEYNLEDSAFDFCNIKKLTQNCLANLSHNNRSTQSGALLLEENDEGWRSNHPS